MIDTSSLNLAADGVVIKPNFLGYSLLEELNLELDAYFSQSATSGQFGVSQLDFSLKRIISPTRISTINILELALDVFFMVIPKNKQKDYLICEIQINSERKNPYKLKFHTDKCKGEIRAQIYLRGGKKNSGGFLYMRQTHLVDLDVEHFIDSSIAERFENKIVECFGLPGDLIAFDASGFHGKDSCISERRTIMFTFYPRISGYKETIDINSSQISRSVRDNLLFFVPDLDAKAKPDWPDNFKSQPSTISKSIKFRVKMVLWACFANFKARFS